VIGTHGDFATPEPPEGAPAQVETLLPLMMVLSATTGLIDAVSVLGLGKVFTANMTGNVVFLGVALAGATGFSPPLYLWAIFTFMTGAVVGGRVGRSTRSLRLAQWLSISAVAETVLLLAAAFVATGYDPEARTPAFGLYAIIALTALAMGYRNATIRQLKIPDITTTVLTLTITGLAADSRLAGGVNLNLGRRVLSVAMLAGGAALGALLVLRSGLVLPLLLAAGLILGSTLLCCARLKP
jgi:uncharacterized membrane protein YoaK (UPF0700 family)